MSVPPITMTQPCGKASFFLRHVNLFLIFSLSAQIVSQLPPSVKSHQPIQVLSSQRCLSSPIAHPQSTIIKHCHFPSPSSSFLSFIFSTALIFISYYICLFLVDFLPSNISFLRITSLPFMSITSSPYPKTHILGAQ